MATLILRSKLFVPSRLATDVDNPVRIVVGQHLIGIHNSNLTAYNAATCPTATSTACTAIWESPTIHPGSIASDGSSIFATGPGPSAHENTLYVTDANGMPTWSAEFPYVQGTDNPYADGLAISGGHALFAIGNLHHGSNYRDRSVHVFSSAGCGASVCSPLRTINTLGTTNIVGDAHHLYALVNGQENGSPITRVQAIDLDAGGTAWRSSWNVVTNQVIPPSGRLAIRGSSLYVSLNASDGGPARTDVYDLGAACPGSPATCTATGSSGEYVLAAVAGTTITYSSSGQLLWYDTSLQSCLGVPMPCTPFASSAAGGASGAAAIANGVLFIVQGTQLLAFDQHGQRACSGAPKVCASLFSYDLGTNNTTMHIAVWDGRLYLQTHNFSNNNNVQHVFTAPS